MGLSAFQTRGSGAHSSPWPAFGVFYFASYLRYDIATLVWDWLAKGTVEWGLFQKWIWSKNHSGKESWLRGPVSFSLYPLLSVSIQKSASNFSFCSLALIPFIELASRLVDIHILIPFMGMLLKLPFCRLHQNFFMNATINGLAKRAERGRKAVS